MPHSLATAVLLLAAAGLACPDQDPYCSFCSGPVCLYCIQSFPGPEGSCIPPSTSIPNCLSYKSDGVCRACNFGFTLGQNACSKITEPDCFEFANGACSFCDKRVLQVNGSCDSGRSCSDANCSLCRMNDGVEVCGLCRPGFALLISGANSFRCVEETAGSANCLRVFNEDLDKCAVCDINYYWKNAHCEKSSAYFVEYRPSEEKKKSLWSLLSWIWGG